MIIDSGLLIWATLYIGYRLYLRAREWPATIWDKLQTRRSTRSATFGVLVYSTSHITSSDADSMGHGGTCLPTFTNGWARGAPWVEEQQSRNWQTVLTITKALIKTTNCSRAGPVSPTLKFVPAPLITSHYLATSWDRTRNEERQSAVKGGTTYTSEDFANNLLNMQRKFWILFESFSLYWLY